MTEYAVRNPATGALVRSYDTATDAEIADAIDRAQAVYQGWGRTTSVADRAALVRRVAELHAERAEQLADLIIEEMGKPRDEAVGEVEFSAAIYEYYADHAEEFLQDEEITLLDGEGTARITREPVGVLQIAAEAALVHAGGDGDRRIDETDAFAGQPLVKPHQIVGHERDMTAGGIAGPGLDLPALGLEILDQLDDVPMPPVRALEAQQGRLQLRVRQTDEGARIGVVADLAVHHRHAAGRGLTGGAMSRHTIGGREPHLRIVLGWDPPLSTYFTQVWDERTGPEAKLLLWTGCRPADLLRASFPGGSITGAPKVRAMEIIAELEPTQRGPYCGMIGYVSVTGTMDTSIAIRTCVVRGGSVYFSGGGGIVADSDPEQEYRETLHKARGMIDALGAPPGAASGPP